MPAQLLGYSSSQIPRSGKRGFLSEDTSSFLPAQPGSLDPGDIEGVLWTFPLLESHRSMPVAFLGHMLSPSGKCHFLTSARKTGRCTREAGGHGSRGPYMCLSFRSRAPGKCRGRWRVSG